MQKLTTVFLTLVLLTVLSCSKNNLTIAEVTVYEKGTTTPAVGIPVNFGYSSTGGVFSSQIVEQTIKTDANGRVSFKAERENESYSVGYPNGTDYFGDGTTLQQGENNSVILYTYPFAYIRVHAKNVNPFDFDDWIDMTSGLLGGGGAGLYGVNVDTVLIRGPFKGTQNGGFGWVVDKNNIRTTFTDQLYFIGRDTINYTINY